MQGGEYLDEDYLQAQWYALLSYLGSELQSFKGSVQEYLARFAPDLHLVGKVYFHLVENKRDDSYPFALSKSSLEKISQHFRIFWRGISPRSWPRFSPTAARGYFPLSTRSFNCSCPDWADMCKHISATLYALGSRLDKEIDLFFQLRGVDIQDLVQSAIQGERMHLQQMVPAQSAETLELADSQLAELFNVNLSTPPKNKRQGKKKRRKKIMLY